MKSKPLNEIAYVRVMLPHIASEEAKRIGLTDKCGKEWKSLSKRLKESLKERYRENWYTNPRLLYKDMSYKRKKPNLNHQKAKAPKQTRQKGIFQKIHSNNTSNAENDMLVDMVVGATQTQREWIREARMDLVRNIRTDELNVSVHLNKHKIEAYNKVPFIVDGIPFFADIYLPEYKIIIDISNSFRRGLDGGRWIANRYHKIKKTGCFLIKFDVSQLKDKNFLHNLVYNLLVSKKQ